MAGIHLLEDHLINKIAAGEVVERPASVVKELLENSLDAGSSEIHIELDEGGKKRITLRDNGRGIAPDQLRLALTRHATSKLSSDEDLFSIQTMGFRGEALASAGSVSRLTLSSRQEGSEHGLKIQVNGGVVEEQGLPYQGPVGTVVSVDDLFFNVPARAKFLKSATTEYSHCWDLIQSLSIAHPTVGFYLNHNGKEKFRAPAVPQQKAEPSIDLDVEAKSFIGEPVLRARVTHVWGDEACKSLLYVQESNKFGSFEGLMSPPGLEKATSRHLLSFVNRRWVKDKTIRYGLMRGYQTHLLKGRFPMAVVFFTCDPSLVDCNVHPAKTELRFQYSGEVQGLLASGVRRVLRASEWASADQGVLDAEKSDVTSAYEKRIEKSFHNPHQPMTFMAAGSERRSPSVRIDRKQHSDSGAYSKEVDANDSQRISSPQPKFETPLYERAGGLASTMPCETEVFSLGASSSTLARQSTPDLNLSPVWSQLKYIGTFARCYLLFEGKDQLLAVDQHAFHERILFEKLLCDRSLLLSSQALLVPEVVDLSTKAIDYLVEEEAYLKASGFKFRILEDRSVEVLSVPAILSGKDLESLFEDLHHPAHQGLSDEPVGASMGQHRLATIACHSAVRAGEDLSVQEVQSLLTEASDVDFFHNCPHGRRVFRWFSKGNVESWFDR